MIHHVGQSGRVFILSVFNQVPGRTGNEYFKVIIQVIIIESGIEDATLRNDWVMTIVKCRNVYQVFISQIRIYACVHNSSR